MYTNMYTNTLASSQSCLVCDTSDQVVCHTANPIWGDIVQKFFQSSKFKARMSLYTESWQQNR